MKPYAAWAVDHPLALAGALGLLLLLVIAARVAQALPDPIQLDPARMYTPDERRYGFDRAGGRCEGETAPFIRCRRPPQHGDHWLPWSLGGATDMNNFVALCARHNTSKGARVPGWFATARLERRRNRYFPAGSPRRPGNITPIF
ncbi:MAG: HNH endonuclease [Nocardioides sp.]